MTERNHVVEKEGQINTDKVGNAIEKIGPERKEQILNDFNEFLSYLSKRIEMGEKIGLGEEQLAKTAEKVGDYLASHEEPRNSEENLLQALWKVGKQEEKHMLAHMLVRLAQNGK
jgi:hypothetical protein